MQFLGLSRHKQENKLRDVDEKYNTNGHIFSFYKQIFGSFDLCGPCEAHAALYAVNKQLASSINTAPSLHDLLKSEGLAVENLPQFRNCPKLISFK